ncbi:uncharacterized protein LOC135463158 [Liolophura sinensis]|uniref:uncharacterized protein LOC135463158 n=1 Tax=Liolophura sinensis TaxID=3198878 RepID=UPI0031590848
MDRYKGLEILTVPLINTEKMRDIWQQQSRHVGCIQDPEAIQLYTCTGTVANDVNFQVYLLDGVYRWNEDRRRDALTSKGGADPISYDGPLQQAVNKLSSEVPGKTFCPNFVPPKKYMGKKGIRMSQFQCWMLWHLRNKCRQGRLLWPSGTPPVTSASE